MKSVFIGVFHALSLITLVAATTFPAEKKVQQLPPIYISIPDMPDCDPKDSFPQLIILPHFHRASQIQHSCDLYDRDNTAWAMTVFYQEWKGHFGDEKNKVSIALNDLMVEWGTEEKRVAEAYSVGGVLLYNPEVVGLALTPTMIWVRANEKHISDTAFVHELVHVALWAANGGADADHEGSEYSGWTQKHTRFIHKMNAQLRKFNL